MKSPEFEKPLHQESLNENEKRPEKQESHEVLKEVYRGVWAESLVDGQELPVGGSLFSKELNIKLKLDFEAFEKELKDFTEEDIEKLYKQRKESVKSWLEKVGSDVDPRTFFICYLVQQKIHKLLEVDPSNPYELDWLAREKMYTDKEPPKLSEFKGKSACAERAALGQYLLQKAGVKSAYVSGITMQDPKNTEEFPDDHSFIVLENPDKPESTLIFDIARPFSQHNLPRILETDVPFTYDLLKDKRELLVGATEVLQGGRLWFGVGDPAAGYHKILEKPKENS